MSQIAAQQTANIPGAGPQPSTSRSSNINAIQTSTDTPPTEVFDTLINSVFSSTSECANTLPVNICNHKELPCFFEFSQACSPRRDEDLVYGLYCLRHTNASNRTFTAIGTQTSVDMQPIYLKTAVCEKNMFLWSFLTNVSYPRAKELISYMNISTTESTNLAKFLMAVSEPQGQRQNSEEFQRMYQYLSMYCQHAIKCLEAIPDRDKIYVPILFTQKFKDNNRKNRLVNDIINKGNERLYPTQALNDNSTQYFVPLTALNILDQINLLSFRIYCGIGRVGLAPNVSVTGDRIYIGSGLSIRNAISSVDISKLRSVYPENIYRLLRKVHGDSVHNNYDILVLLAVPSAQNLVINPQIFIAKRKFILSSFDIDKLDILSIC